MSNRLYILQRAGCVALLALLVLAPVRLRAAENTQPHRDLLIFEMSSTMKKDLPATKDLVAKLFASNMNNEIHPGDDIAVWTVDDGLHSATDLITSWEPEDAAIYTGKVWEFLMKQKYSRHASLTPIQPSLNRVMRNCQHLTVLIFCDSNARILGTPFDANINGVITNSAAKVKGGPVPLVLVLRSFEGDYIGSSVNVDLPLKFPKFPPPPRPVAPTVVNSNPTPPSVSEPPKRIEGPIVTPIPAMIIVGTNAGTNISILTNAPPRAVPAPPPPSHPAQSSVTVPPPASPMATNAAVEPAVPAPSSVRVAVAPPAAPAPTPVPAEPQVAPAVAPSAPPAVAQSNDMVAAAATRPGRSLALFPLIIGVGALAAALVIVARILSARRPRNSLITSSMHDNQQQPPPPSK